MQRNRINAVLLACVTLSSVAHAQLLNPSFEAAGGSLGNWGTFNDVIGNVNSDSTTPRTGGSVAKLYGGFNGNPNFSGMLQNLPASEGEIWTASIWARHNTGDALTGTGNELTLKIEFYAVQNGAYGTSDMLGEFGEIALDASSPRDAWLETTVQATAPPGTVEARLALVFTQPSNEGGAALVDDVSMGADGGGWVMVWNDEFDSPSIDTTKWRVEDIHIIKNNELQYYAPDDVYVDNGDLVLRSQARSYQGFDTSGAWRNFDYTSGLVETRGKFAFQYGKVEIRAQLPGTHGMWPAHWMLADGGGWPPEIDIMEMLGQVPYAVHMSNHWGPIGPNGEPPWEIGQTETGTYYGPDFTAGYHTFGIEWFEDRIHYLVDGVVRFTASGVVPDEPFYLILNTAVGGSWPGPPNGSSVFPQYHKIDYVRIYSWSGAGAGLQTIDDVSPLSATVDGVVGAGEYIGSANGVNSGLFDVIGDNSTLSLDSSGDGMLNIALESTTPYLNPYGVTLYIDSVEGGFPSTSGFQDVADRPRRLATGRGTEWWERSQLFFAPGFLADYAITLQPSRVRILALGETAHTTVNGANAGEPLDINGGTDVSYAVTGDVVRELKLPLSALGLNPGDSFRVFGTLSHAENAFRSNEFIGVAPGNAFDGANPGNATVLLKSDDFITFVTAEAVNCSTNCSVPGGDADVDEDCDVDLSDLAETLANFGRSSVSHTQGDTDFDGDVDLTDLANLLSRFGTSCP